MIFSYQYLLKKYNISPKGVVHIGAHKAEECVMYSRCGTDNVLWIEGNPDLLPVILENVSIYSQNKAYQVLLSDIDNQDISLKVTNASMSSSILELGIHKEQYPTIKVEKEIKLYSSRFDSFVRKNNISINEYDFVNIDIQGAELLALKGFGDFLNNFNFIYTEVNVDYLYEGCPLLDEIEDFLTEKGFQRVELSLEYKNWGDAFYVRKTELIDNDQNVGLSAKDIMKNFQENKTNKKKYKKRSLFYIGVRKIYNGIFRNPKNEALSLIDISGEKEFALKMIKQYCNEGKFIFFDIGANIGEYSEMIIQYCNELNIEYELHIFEPQKECLQVLQSKFKSNPNVIINDAAVSSTNGFIDFFVESSGSALSSVYQREVFAKSDKIQVRTIVLDDYIDKNNIGKINFIKIDVEGHEHEVLKSLKDSFYKIDNIQFEYGGTYLDSKSTLKEVYFLLRDHFHLGKINLNGVDFVPYITELEDYEYSNYIAENKRLGHIPIDYSKN